MARRLFYGVGPWVGWLQVADWLLAGQVSCPLASSWLGMFRRRPLQPVRGVRIEHPPAEFHIVGRR